jgi:type IV secretory pathway VirB2 component (pilin)
MIRQIRSKFISLFERTYIRATAISMMLLVPGFAHAQQVGSPVDGMVTAVCSIIKPLTGQSKIISLIFLIALGVMIFLWWMNENKEGVITWILRTGLAIGVLINLVTLPTLIGLPSVC